METIADRIKNERTKQGYSQEDLAKKCGWANRSYISRIEKSQNNVTLKNIKKIAKALCVSENHLLNGQFEPPVAPQAPFPPNSICNEKFGKRVQNRREKLNMTQSELMTKIGYSNKSSISTLEEGKIDVPLSKLILLADALSCSIDYLITGEDDASDDAFTTNDTGLSIIADCYENLSLEKRKEIVKFAMNLQKD